MERIISYNKQYEMLFFKILKANITWYLRIFTDKIFARQIEKKQKFFKRTKAQKN